MKNIWKSILLSAVMLTAGFAISCAPEEIGDDKKAVITINPTSLAANVAEGATTTITITTNGTWSANLDNSIEDNVTIEPAAGYGNSTVTVTIPPHATRTFDITFNTEKPRVIEGFAFISKAKAILKVYQNEGGVDENNYIYYEDCGASVEKGSDGYWPSTANFTGWSRKGEGQSGVKYGGSSSSVRNSGSNYSPVDASYVSGAPYIFLNGATQVFEIKNIALDGTTENLSFSFTISAQDGYNSTPTFAVPNNNTVKLEISTNGSQWSQVEFTATPDGGNGWYHAVSSFKVPAGTTSLYVRFSGYNPPSSGGLRLDDFKLIAGGNGSDLEVQEAIPATLAEITKEGLYKVSNATVVAAYARGVLLKDSSNAMLLAYLGETDLGYKEGDIINIEGSVSTYNTSLQFGEGSKIEKVGTTTVNHGTPTPFHYEMFLDYGATSSPEILYVNYVGKLTLSSNSSSGMVYYNIVFDEGGDVQGSIQYPRDAELVKSFEGQYVNVTGYLIGWTSSGKYISTMYTEISENKNVISLNVNPASLNFGVDGGSQDVSFSTGSLGEQKVFATLSGDNADKFTKSEPANGKITVTAQANTSDAAYSATLTIYIAATADGERAAEKSVKISQSTPNASKLELTAEDINTIDFGGASSYTSWELTSASGDVWVGCSYPRKEGYLQLGWDTDTTKAASTSYIMTPSLGGKKISKVIITPDAKTTNSRNFAIFSEDFVYAGETPTEAKAKAYAVSAATVKGSTTPLTIDWSGVTTTDKVIIRAVGGAAYVSSITIEFAQ